MEQVSFEAETGGPELNGCSTSAVSQEVFFFFFKEGTVPWSERESARQPPYVCFCGRGPRKKRHTQKVIPPDWQVHGVSWPFIQLSKADSMFGRGITNRSKRSTLLPFDHHPKDLGWPVMHGLFWDFFSGGTGRFSIHIAVAFASSFACGNSRAKKQNGDLGLCFLRGSPKWRNGSPLGFP